VAVDRRPSFLGTCFSIGLYNEYMLIIWELHSSTASDERRERKRDRDRKTETEREGEGSLIAIYGQLTPSHLPCSVH
jgi:hypothetical protein